MTEAWRKGWLFAGGMLLGGVLVVGAYRAWVGPSSSEVSEVPASASAPVAAAAPAAPAAAEPDAGKIALAPPAPATGCEFGPVVPAGANGDGQFNLDAALAAEPAPTPSAFLAVAQEAAGKGRPRDAEVALIAACRAAGRTAGVPSTPLADAKSNLGQHYAALAAAAANRPAAADLQPELLRRAESLFGDSVKTYTAALGQNASKTRMASQRLAALSQPGSMPSEDTAVLGAAKPFADTDVYDESAGGGCAAPRSAAERLVCGDPELAQLENDLDRLRAQARSVTRDPGGFAKRQEQAWAQRESNCKDKGCLLRWYAQRRGQLLAEF